jgi:hypothetical protein
MITGPSPVLTGCAPSPQTTPLSVRFRRGGDDGLEISGGEDVRQQSTNAPTEALAAVARAKPPRAPFSRETSAVGLDADGSNSS